MVYHEVFGTFSLEVVSISISLSTISASTVSVVENNALFNGNLLFTKPSHVEKWAEPTNASRKAFILTLQVSWFEAIFEVEGMEGCRGICYISFVASDIKEDSSEEKGEGERIRKRQRWHPLRTHPSNEQRL